MAKRRTKKKTSPKLPPFWLILFVLVLVQAAWIAAFVRTTGTWIPMPRRAGKSVSSRAEAPAVPAPRASAPDERDTKINELQLTVQNLQRRLRMDREERMADTKVQELIEKRGSKGGE